MLPPVPEGPDLLVDGGVLNSLPIDMMRELNPSGPVIAVDVVQLQGPFAKSDYGLIRATAILPILAAALVIAWLPETAGRELEEASALNSR